MSESSLRVIAQGRAHPGAIEEIKDALKSLVESMQDHEYCVRYEVWVDEQHETDFVIYQEWTDEEALRAHLDSPLVQEVGYELGRLVVGPPVVWHYRRVL